MDQWNDTERYHDLDIDRPVLQLTPISTTKQISEQIKIIAQIIDADDFVALHYLFEDGLVKTLCDVNKLKEDFKNDVFDILAKLSSSDRFNSQLTCDDVLYSAIRGLSDKSVEVRSKCYKIIHNLFYENSMKTGVFVGHPKAVQSDFDFNLVFVHGLLGKLDNNHVNIK